jgi:signal transduction histidine kinase
MFWRAGLFRSGVALYCLLIGALMFIAPHQFDSRAYLLVRPQPIWWGLAFILTGGTLIVTASFAAPRWLPILAHAAAVVLLLTLAATAIPNRAWLGPVWYGVLALGIVVAALPPRRQAAPKPPSGDLLSLAIGLSGFASGLIIITLPSQLAAPVFDPVRSWFPFFAVSFSVGGLVVAVNQLRPIRSPIVVRAAHLLLGAGFWAFAVPFVPGRSWTGISYCVLFGGAVALQPWVEGYLRRRDPASLRARLAVTSGLVVALALIAIIAISTTLEEQTATVQARVEQQAQAEAIAANVGDFVDKEHDVLVTLGQRTDLAGLDPASFQHVLQTYATSYTEVGVFAAFDPIGNAIARSDGLPPTSYAGQPIIDDVRRAHGFVLELAESHLLNTSVVAFGAPFDDSQGRLAGILFDIVETGQLAPVVTRGNIAADGRAYLVDGSGRLIVDSGDLSNRTFADASPRPAVQAFLRGGPSGTGSLIYGDPGSETIAAYARVPNLAWGVVVERPLAAVLSATRTGQDTSFLALVAICALAALIGAWLADRLVRPLRQLGRAIAAYPDDGTPVALPRTGVTEVAQLTSVFDDLQTRLTQRTAEREQALTAERAARAEAEAAVAARDEFLSIAAHELKTPITSLRGFAQLAHRQLRRTGQVDPERLELALTQIERQSERLTRLINQLLDLTRLDAGRLTLTKQPADVDGLVDEVVTAFRQVHPQREFRFEERRNVRAVVDGLRLEQVVTNLLDNAVKFSPASSPIEVAVRSEGPAAVQIAVRDHGPGIPADDRDRVFERFYRGQASKESAGLGLGLAISQEIILLHGGQIFCELPTDGGTRFVVQVPLS